MKKPFILIFLIFTYYIHAEAGIKITHGPYLQEVGETGATIMWITDRDAVSWVEIAPDDNSHFYAQERHPYYETTFGKRNIGKLHAVHVDKLAKGTKYRYRIFSKEIIEEQANFVQYGAIASSDVYTKEPLYLKTLDDQKDHIRFCMVNDIHADNALFSSLMKGIKNKDVDFVLLNGDMVSSMESEEQICQGFLSAASNLFASEIPFYFVRGNHETRGKFSTQFIRYFPTSTGQPYYAFREGPAYFIIMDGGEDKPDSDIEYSGLSAFDQYRANETEWLKSILNSEEFKSAPFKIAVMHVPPINSTWHGSIQVKEQFIPLLNKAGIDLMLCGHLHDHSYLDAGVEGCQFPILINSNTHRSIISVNPSGIGIEITDTNGKLFKEIKLDRKN